MNAPTLYDRFIVPEGKRKVAFEADTKVASAGTFTVQREDHTLGNLIRMCVTALGWAGLGRRSCALQCRLCASVATGVDNPMGRACATRGLTRRMYTRLRHRQLHSDDKVIFAGYQMPHPLVNELKIKARGSARLLLRTCALVSRCAGCHSTEQQIQTRAGSKAVDDSEYTPQRALVESINDVQTELTTLRRAFEAEAQRVTGLSRGY